MQTNKLSYSDFDELKKTTKKKYGSYGSDKYFRSGIILSYVNKYKIIGTIQQSNIVIIEFDDLFRKEIGCLQQNLVFYNEQYADTFLSILSYLHLEIWGTKIG